MEQELKLNTHFFGRIKADYRPGTEDEKVLNHSFEHDIFFKEIPSFCPSTRPVIIDVGAHIGTFSLLCATKYPHATIYAYEPCVQTFRILEKNQALNKFDGLHVYHQAVAGVKGKTKLYHSEKTGNWGHSITKELSESFEEVNTTTLEAIVNENGIEFIDLIKFNCEGAEFEILFSTTHQFIRKIGLGIVLYHEDLSSKNGDANRLADLFRQLNFRVVTIRKSQNRGWLIVWNKEHYSWIYFSLKALMRKLRI